MAEFKIKNPNKYTNSDIFLQENNATLFRRDEEWFVAGCETQEEADALILAHNPTPPSEPTIADKLASVGLSLDELKAAILGGN